MPDDIIDEKPVNEQRYRRSDVTRNVQFAPECIFFIMYYISPHYAIGLNYNPENYFLLFIRSSKRLIFYHKYKIPLNNIHMQVTHIK